MDVATVQGVPATVRAGDTTIFQIADPAYSNADWFYDFIVTRRGRALAKIRATESGTGFLVTIDSSISGAAGFTPGRATYYERFTSKASAQVDTPRNGILTILPNPARDLPRTDNQVALELCIAAVKELMTGGENVSVNFNGEAFTKRNMRDLLDARDRLQVLVDNELRAIGASDGAGSGYKLVRFRFR